MAEARERTYVTHLADNASQLQLSITVVTPHRPDVGVRGITFGFGQSLESVEEALGLRRLSPVRPSSVTAALGWVLAGQENVETLEQLLKEQRPAGLGLVPVPKVTPSYAFFILDFAEWASFAEVVPVEESPPTGRSLAALTAGGGGSLVAGASDEPMLLAYAFGALVIVRVADPILSALGEGLAEKVRTRLGPPETG
jgi:hypothetical protein